MRRGWSDKDAAVVLEIRPSKVSQSLVPAIRKVARLSRIDPLRTRLMIEEAMEQLDPMTDEELELLRRLQTGRLDRDELHPRRRKA